MSIEGRNKTAARAGGHIITHHDDCLHMFGGRDALGAQVAYLLKLKRTAGSRWGYGGVHISWVCAWLVDQCGWPAGRWPSWEPQD